MSAAPRPPIILHPVPIEPYQAGACCFRFIARNRELGAEINLAVVSLGNNNPSIIWDHTIRAT